MFSSATPVDSHIPPAIPEKIFGYDVIDFIGEGAGSILYVVSHPESKQIYALKHVVRKTDRHARFIEQLENEFEVSQHFGSPNLRKAIEMKENKTLLRKVTEAILVLEMFDGQPLEALKPKDTVAIVDCFIQVAKGLEALHHLGYVHCDLKPNNILLGPTGQVKVIDFGQACKVGTVKERIQGTPDYIAPEQVKCEPVTVRTDVFNFGATLYWALAGRTIPTLFTLKRSDNSFLMDDRIASPRDINPLIPENLSGLVMECVRTKAEKRPADMTEIIRRLELIRHVLTRKNASVSASA